MSSFIWHFPSTDNGEEDGLNDPLRENFEGNHEWFVAREMIQNSADATTGKGPVRVRFERVLIPTESIPGKNQLSDILKRAKEYASGQEGADEFYDEAVAMISASEIAVLKISDFNTTGLNGEDNEKKGEWYRLIRATGASSMSGAGGGSFGIGKGAPFAASALRTVFYSTVNELGQPAFQGKARISSFELNGDIKRGTGLFGTAKEKGVGAIREISEIPEAFRRCEVGTDIYVVGYLTEKADWRSQLMLSVIQNFWAAIHLGELIVSFAEEGSDDEEINTTNLEEYLIKFSESDEAYTHEFFKALTDGTAIHGDLERLGKCSLFVKKAEGYPKMVQMMRKSKMVIKTTPPSAFRVLAEPYSAVFVCFSNEGNRKLRALEPPTHDDWDPARDRASGPQIVREMTNFIRDTLRSLSEENNSQPEEIPDLNYYLPEQDEVNAGSGDAGPITSGAPPAESGSESGVNRPLQTAPVSKPPERRVAIVKSAGLGGDEETERQGEGTATKGKGSADSNAAGDVPYIDLTKIKFRSRQIRKDGKEVYQIVIRSTSAQNGSLRINSVGEDASYPISINVATLEDGSIVETEGSTLKGLNLRENEPLRLFVELPSSRRYVIGVS